jgi:hypothetical protein
MDAKHRITVRNVYKVSMNNVMLAAVMVLAGSIHIAYGQSLSGTYSDVKYIEQEGDCVGRR